MSNSPNFATRQFVTAAGLNAAAAATQSAQHDTNSAFHTPGVINSASAAYSQAGMVLTANLPAPFAIEFGSGALSFAHGTTTNADTQTYTVNFAPLIPGAGSVTVFLLASAVTIQQQPYTVVGPPQGHPSYNPNYQPVTAYAANVESIALTASTTPANNVTTFELGRTTLTFGQTTLAALDTSHVTHASSLLAPTGVTAGTYTFSSVTVGADGRLTSAANGFTPVQQAGGTGMLTNHVFIGWNGSDLLGQVDTTALGAFAFKPWVTANFLNLTTGGTVVGNTTFNGTVGVKDALSAPTVTLTATSGTLIGGTNFSVQGNGNLSSNGTGNFAGALFGGSLTSNTNVAVPSTGVFLFNGTTTRIAFSNGLMLLSANSAANNVTIDGSGSVAVPGTLNVSGNAGIAGQLDVGTGGLVVANEAAFSCPFGSNPAGTDTSGLIVGTHGDVNAFTTGWNIGTAGSGGAHIAFYVTATVVGSIAWSAADGLLHFNQTSDSDIKIEIEPLTGALERMRRTQAKRFRMVSHLKPEGHDKIDGFIADESALSVPNAVTGEKGVTTTRTNAVVSANGGIAAEGISEEDFKAELAKPDTLTLTGAVVALNGHVVVTGVSEADFKAEIEKPDQLTLSGVVATADGRALAEDVPEEVFKAEMAKPEKISLSGAIVLGATVLAHGVEEANFTTATKAGIVTPGTEWRDTVEIQNPDRPAFPRDAVWHAAVQVKNPSRSVYPLDATWHETVEVKNPAPCKYPRDATWHASITKPVYQQLDPTKKIPLMWAGISELDARTIATNDELAAQASQINQLASQVATLTTQLAMLTRERG